MSGIYMRRIVFDVDRDCWLEITDEGVASKLAAGAVKSVAKSAFHAGKAVAKAGSALATTTLGAGIAAANAVRGNKERTKEVAVATAKLAGRGLAGAAKDAAKSVGHAAKGVAQGLGGIAVSAYMIAKYGKAKATELVKKRQANKLKRANAGFEIGSRDRGLILLCEGDILDIQDLEMDIYRDGKLFASRVLISESFISSGLSFGFLSNVQSDEDM